MIKPGTRCCECGHCAYCISYNDFAGMPDGTRCECRDLEKPCERDAVRMVTVRVGERNPSVRPDAVPVSEWEPGIFSRVPMCEPCAQWHEKKHADGCRCPECDPDWNDPRNEEDDITCRCPECDPDWNDPRNEEEE